ncbi:hypothetical protein KDA_67330 [Dictyobacter alpinus]|uniref:Uncharacterized protein n=1 Tax=Dictyobacter alpinus TaxID=2014873 RepID=A0A402BIT2_9CHLR|nr:hypothetical protein [Dictyobacter alpinus]GCE31249.1 hypothetical protein KDA_67330 [Dictyobacter alpinus]
MHDVFEGLAGTRLRNIREKRIACRYHQLGVCCVLASIYGEKMSDFLYFRIIVTKPNVKQNYWWPLIFEGAHQASFCFQSPLEQKKQGFYYVSQDEACTFQELWKLLYESDEKPLVSFWQKKEKGDDFVCDISLIQENINQWKIDITIEDTQFGKANKENTEQRVISFLYLGLAISELCSYSSIDLCWDEESEIYPLMQIKEEGQEYSLDAQLFHNKLLTWKEFARLNKHIIFVSTPFPIRVGGREGFRYISL